MICHLLECASGVGTQSRVRGPHPQQQDSAAGCSWWPWVGVRWKPSLRRWETRIEATLPTCWGVPGPPYPPGDDTQPQGLQKRSGLWSQRSLTSQWADAGLLSTRGCGCRCLGNLNPVFTCHPLGPWVARRMLL